MRLISIYNTCKHQKTSWWDFFAKVFNGLTVYYYCEKARSSGFLMFSGDIERDKWTKSGQTVIYQKGD